jgi:two-component system sensor histidine kinase/response regulator
MARILVIDDEETFRGLLVAMLEDEGHSILSAADGTAGVALARDAVPDLILCDVCMGGLDGYGVLAALRQDPLTAIIPVIFLTGVGDPAAVRKGMELGADDYLTKPIPQKELVRAVEARLARHAEARQEIRRRFDSLKANIARSLPHEFLTPLTAVIGLSSLLMDEGVAPLEPQAVREVAQGIFLGGQRLHEIISKLTLYAELEAARDASRADWPPVQKGGAVVEAIARARAARFGRAADLEVHAEDVPIALPESYLRALVEELVENALVFSVAGTPVIVRLNRDDAGRCLLSISDRGRGISAEQRQGFATHVPSRRHDQEPGMGLGLTIVHQIAQLSGGQVSFETAPGQGTIVRVELPPR